MADGQELAMLSFLQTLPKDSLIAGHPIDMDRVPLFSKRKVLAGRYQASNPLEKKFNELMKKRIIDTLRAMYTSEWNILEQFIEQYGIDALVLRKERFVNLHAKIYYEPYESIIRPQISSTSPPILSDPPSSLRCFENDHYIVLCWFKKRP